jgi:hypothetical protein
VFDFFAGFHPFSADMWEEPSERQIEQMEASSHFLAVVTQDDVSQARTSDDGCFEKAFRHWVSFLGRPPDERKRFAVLLFGPKAIAWWRDKWQVRDDLAPGRFPFYDGSMSVQRIPELSHGLAAVKHTLEAFLRSPVFDGPARVVVLGEPTEAAAAAAAVSAAARGVEAAVSDDSDIGEHIHRRNPDYVELWKSGWSIARERLSAQSRAEFLRKNPIFVRPVLDDRQTIARVRGDMIQPLIEALGYTDEERKNAWEEIDLYRRVFWRPTGDWLDVTNAIPGREFAITGPIRSAVEQLVAIAGLGSQVESVVRTRFEDLPDQDPKRKLLANKLQELGAVAEKTEDDTVPVSLNGLAESIKKFDRAKLNIVAAHDQRTRPGDKQDTINHFEDWDAKIEQHLQFFFPRNPPKVLRVAVLFQNVDKFDGLRFAEGLTVNRWHLLKLQGKPGSWAFDPENVNSLKDNVSFLLQQGA